MEPFDFPPPTPSDLGDREVPRDGHRLDGARVALMVTGGIAAFKAPLVARALRRQGAQVTAFCSDEALRYVTQDALEWSTNRPVVVRLSAHAEHLSDEAPFDAYLVAPATAASIGRMAHGIAEGAIGATMAAAIGRMERGHACVLVAPTMHGSMHSSILVDNLARLHRIGVRVIAPRDAHGKHNLPEESVLVEETCRAVEAVRAVSPNPRRDGGVRRP
jgi:phosphopantothenoylcysteine decarboxylase/phosphopantothenate--cysteine ligase